ncbi:GNAT superfamily N-acetyltransferase [Deinobacterium chartae]|uniref:GNAT superfamily N-acetyltransferase n=1 Tax=Deinobacterium chartae TaxID=521158 RepID=A0A841HXF8_9DEIO|nr:GNAT family N-acetyltransferase [Deinobacterium chartae]MBB6097334.1 GNAT superfamily N-acetyltransferase [Deinobacterium chartae]
MLLTSTDLATQLETAEALHLEAQVQALRTLRPQLPARTLPVGGGIAALTDPAYGRKLNHVCAFGMGQEVTEADLLALEALYHPHGLAVEVDLCPHAHPTALRALAARGYRATSFSQTYACPLDANAAHLSPDLEVRPLHPDEAGAFVAASSEGFAAQPNPRPLELLEVLARCALLRADSTAFVALTGGEIAGTAAVARLDLEAGPVAFLYIASTRPDFRGRGVQAALLRARLAHARQQGQQLAVLTTRVGNASSRNAERAGFRLAYTRTTFVRRP